MSTNDIDETGPQWLKPLLEAKFFDSCEAHQHLARNECNLYCIDCKGNALCSPCTIDHRSHRMIQIRRSSYHNVIRASEIHKVLDISGVQPYVINSAKVLFLNQRPQFKPTKSTSNVCKVCDRGLADNYYYCSLECKLIGITQRKDMTFTFQPKQQQQNRSKKQREFESRRDEDSTIKAEGIDPFVLFLPHTPPPSSTSSSNSKRRKGIPQRAPV